ncbi:MAG: hypothetical protein GC165_12490 [Armatimonadetes bacterium]|nr:hypothetical protein [Armatimonadota bacterium]
MKHTASRKMTRRDFNLKAMTLVGGSGLVLSGCGGFLFGSSGSANNMATVAGQVALPSGVDLTSLQVVGGGGFGTLTASSFSVNVQTQIPSLTMIWDSVGQRILLMGIIDSGSANKRLDAASTAAALMFLGVGGIELNTDDRRSLMERILASPELATLTTVLENELASDPFAVANAPQTLKDAIKTAVDSFSGGASNSAVRAGERRAGKLSQSTQADTTLLLLQPGSEVDGLTFVQTSSPLGYQVQNTKRRFGRVLTYVTGHVDENDVETAETPPSIVGSPLDIPLTVGLLNSSGQGWSQVTSSSVPLKIIGQDKQTKYEMIALSPVFGASTPPIYSDTRYAGEIEKWKDECGQLRQSVMLGGFMEVVLEILGLGGAAMSYSAVQGAIAGLLTSTQVIRSAMSAAYLGNVFYGQVIGELASKMTFEEIFYAELPLLETLTLKIKGDLAANAVRNAFLGPRLVVARAALVALVALGIIELADILAIAKDTTSGNEANLWTGLVFKPTVSISATSDTYTPGGQVVLSAHAPSTGATLLYHWKGSGSNLMVLDDGVVYDKLEFDSDKSVVTLSTTPSTVGDLTVQCEVFDVSGGGRVSLGKASKVLPLDPGNHNFTLDVVEATRTFASGYVVTFKYIAIGITVDETGATGLKISHPNQVPWTFKGSAFTGHSGVLDIYNPQVDINGDLQINGVYDRFFGEQQGANLVRIGANKAYFPGYWTPYNWRVDGQSQAEVDSKLAALQTDIDALVAQLRSEIQVQNLPGY